jgi:hypothetical protein
VVHDPAIFIEAEQAQLSERVADAREHVVKAARYVARQQETIEELECAGHPTRTAKRLLATLAATQHLRTGDYERLLQQLERAVTT